MQQMLGKLIDHWTNIDAVQKEDVYVMTKERNKTEENSHEMLDQWKRYDVKNKISDEPASA